MKINKKIVFYSSLGIVAASAITTVVVIKIQNPYKPAFYTFSSYLDKGSARELDKHYKHKEYATVSDFEYLFENNKAIGGITSDYAIVNLIKKGSIAPISKKLEVITGITTGFSKYYTDETNEQMTFFDQFLDEETQIMLRSRFGKEYASNYVFKFSDFIVPYFLNDRVYAYNTEKMGLGSNSIPTPEFKDYSVANVLKALVSQNKNKNTKIQWSKNEFENTVFGSEYNNGTFSTELDITNYQQIFNNWNSLIVEGTGKQMNDSTMNIFENDSDVVLNNLVNPQSRITASILYNGDALDAYYGHDNFASTQDGDRIRIVRTKNNIRILDAIVVSSSISDAEQNNVLKRLDPIIFNNMFKTKQEIEVKADQLEQENKSIYSENGIMKIFDYVNYTPAAKGAYEYIFDNYFIQEDESIDTLAREIFIVNSNLPGYKAFPMYPIDKQTLSELKHIFNKKLNS